MDTLLKEVKRKLQKASSKIDLDISNFLTSRLGVDTIDTINSLTYNEKGTYSDRLELLLKVVEISNIETGKITVFKDICKRFSNITHFNNLEQCFNLMPSNAHFLFIIYPQRKHLSKEEEYKRVIYELIDDVKAIISEQTIVHKIRIIEDEQIRESSFGIKNVLSYFLPN